MQKRKEPLLGIRIFLVFFWVVFIFFLLFAPNFGATSSVRTLHIFTWSDLFDEQTIRNFEKDTGINVHFNYYDSNEELLVKLKATKGHGHDLIIPSDYSTKILIEQELIKPIDYSRIDFKNRLLPELLNHDFDPDNIYSMPLNWEVYGFTYDKEHFKGKLQNPNWNHIFQPKNYRIAMTNDPVEAFNMASFHLHGKQQHLTSSQTSIVRDTLTSQKKYIEAYGSFRITYLIATKNCPLAISSSSYSFRMFDEYPILGFAIPKEGTFVSIENIAIPAQTENDDLIYTFLNYVYRQDNIQRRCAFYAQFPPTRDGLPTLHPDYIQTFHNALKSFPEFCFFRHLAPEQTLRDIWIDVKS
ncbi:MAG TPA: extracellular solute-binding protein [Chlamydiales bacterium]|nr:extracellular solute-binding protein [Chlamydiales bacterium]